CAESGSKAILSPSGAYEGVESCSAPGKVSWTKLLPSVCNDQRAQQVTKLVKTMVVPSGDQSGSPATSSVGVIRRTLVPWPLIRYTPLGTPPRLALSNAIVFPSGEYAGLESYTLCLTSKCVIAVRPRPSILTE